MTAIAQRGLIEGFYGPPWSFDDRRRAVRFLGERGGTTYVYAPKNDPLHRDRWREPYLAEEWEAFASLATEAAELGVDVWFGLSPLGLRVSDPDDVDALLRKLRAADAHGLHDLCLLVDDMPESFASSSDAERFPTLAAAHARMVEIVQDAQRQWGPDRRLWFVPLHYHGDPDDAYVREIGASIDPDVAIMWTGPEVCSETISADHSAAVAARLQRPVLYWDNHPVNDGDMRYDPHLNPLTGRDADLSASTSGILANVALEPEASLIAVATFLDYARDPAGYDPEASWYRALADICGDDGDAAAVATLAELAPRSPLQRGEPHYASLEPLRRFLDSWHAAADDRDRDRALAAVTAFLDGLRATARRLEDELANERLCADLAPWSRKLRLQTDAAATAVAVLAAVHRDDGTFDVAAARHGVLDTIADSRRTFHRVAGHHLETFARTCLQLAEAAAEAGS